MEINLKIIPNNIRQSPRYGMIKVLEIGNLNKSAEMIAIELATPIVIQMILIEPLSWLLLP